MSSSHRSRSRRFRGLLVNILVVIMGVVALFLLVGLFLPRTYRVERSVEVRSSSTNVYVQLSDLRRWPEWTVWNTEMDPTARFEYPGAESGVGAEYKWTGDKLGRGHLKLTRAEPARGVWYDLDFEEGAYGSNGSILMKPSGDTVEVVWLNEGDLGRSPVNRYFGLFIDSMLGTQMQEGLARLKVRVESGITATGTSGAAGVATGGAVASPGGATGPVTTPSP